MEEVVMGSASYIDVHRKKMVLDLSSDPDAARAAEWYIREVRHSDAVEASRLRAQLYSIVLDPWHACHFCGELVAYGYDGEGQRHWLSDCRPDLAPHQPGPQCTWAEWVNDPSEGIRQRSCYAYQDWGTREWTNEHAHFHNDGPM
jgi:hypothetical protein